MPYSAPLIVPSGPLPALARAWSASAMIPAHCGGPALVPPTTAWRPPRMTTTPAKLEALYETSGTVRFELPLTPDWYGGDGKSWLGAPPVAPPPIALSFHVSSPP